MEKLFHSIRRASGLFLLCLITLAVLFISGSVYAEDGDEEAVPDNGIPVIYINIDESQGTIEDMIASPKHTVYCYGKMSIAVPEGFHYADFPDNICESLEDLDISMRGRGNSTWAHNAKKPFKIKLDKKQDIFGLGKNKHWVLLANTYDKSQLKDRVTAWLSDRIGFEFTPRGVPVDLVLSGEEYGTHYLGSYYFSENVRVDENRLEIEELEEDDTDYPTITGGYLVQNGIQVADGSPDRFYTDRGECWATNTPSFDTEGESDSGGGGFGPLGEPAEESFELPELGDAYENSAQQEYIQNHMQLVEDTLFEGGTAYRDLMDLETSAKYWWVQVFSLNCDGFQTGSTYIYKRRDTDGVTSKMYWGPCWDFDFAWDYYFTTEGFTPGHNWLKPMFCDREEGGFLEEVYKQWPAFREAILEIIEDGGIMDQYAAETKASAETNETIWRPDSTDFDYDASVETFRTWIIERLAWVDEHLYDLDHLVHTVTYVIDGETSAVDFVTDEESLKRLESIPEKEGYIFLGWMDEEGNLYKEAVKTDRDIVFTAKFISEEDAVPAADIAFRKASDITRINYFTYSYIIEYSLVPSDAEDRRIEWSSSDENLATVDENGHVDYTGCGDVIITAKLRSGVSRDFHLYIVESYDMDVPESIEPDRKVIYMNPGEETCFTVTTEPDPAKIEFYAYSSDDENVVSVSDFGVLKANGPGETTVHLVTTSYSRDGKVVECTTEVTVIVTEPEITYTASPSEASWKKGSKDDLVITVSRDPDDETCFAHFSRVLTDGTPLARDTDYTAVSGSTIITLKAATLEKLSAGTHTVKAEFDDGETEIKLIVEENDTVTPGGKDSPDTGDHRNMGWLWIMGVSLLVFSGALYTKKRME